ncbi:hypothetical protein [Paraglaciecola marina]|uniref:hypothetical protein n=1 Tax=Paraglaciecola marina TaxID=2500157 RepID=UPI00105F7201|nr:hypothetical protein [Paraglaciecola marina]
MFCETLRRKYALLQHYNAYWHAAKAGIDKNANLATNRRTYSDKYFSRAFGITLIKDLSHKKNRPSETSIKKIIKFSEDLYEAKCIDDKTPKYPYLAELDQLSKTDFLNEPGTDDDVYSFALKLGYCLMKDGKTYSEGCDISEDCYVRNEHGELVVDRIAVLKAIDEVLWSAPSQGSVHLKSYDEAEENLEGYRGVYAVYYPVNIGKNKRYFFKSALRISHVVASGGKKGVIRAKLNMRNLTMGGGDYYQYRGKFIPMCENKFGYFTFELDTKSISGEMPDHDLNEQVQKKITKKTIREEMEIAEARSDSVLIMCNGLDKDFGLTDFTGVISSLNQRESGREFRSPYSSVALFIKQDFEDMSEIEKSKAEYKFMTEEMNCFKSINELKKDNKAAAKIFNSRDNSWVLKPPKRAR